MPMFGCRHLLSVSPVGFLAGFAELVVGLEQTWGHLALLLYFSFRVNKTDDGELVDRMFEADVGELVDQLFEAFFSSWKESRLRTCIRKGRCHALRGFSILLLLFYR